MAPKTKAAAKPVITDDLGLGATVLASEIKKVAAAARVLMGSDLAEKTIVLLLSHSSGVSQVNCKKVLEAAQGLARNYLK